MQKLEDIKVWQKSMKLVTSVYEITSAFPTEEKFGLVSQMRHSAISIPSNISEGAGRHSPHDFAHFLSIASGSAYELQTQLIVSYNLSLIDQQTRDVHLDEVEEIQKMLFSFHTKLKGKTKISMN